MSHVLCLVLLALAACGPARQGLLAASNVPPPSACVEHATRCTQDTPEVCARDRDNVTRWLASAPAPCPNGCAWTEAGGARCLPRATDGGAP